MKSFRDQGVNGNGEGSVKRVIIFGAGGHGKVLADVAMRSGLSVAGFVDDRLGSRMVAGLEIPVLGDRAWLLGQSRDTFCCALGVGDNFARMHIGELLKREGFELAMLISPFAAVAPSATIAAGVSVMAGSVINPLANLGEGVIVNSGAIVEHDVKVGRYASVQPNSVLAGGVEIGELAQVALSATVLPCLRIGCRSTLGAGSVATRSIPDDVIAYGIPARVQRVLQKDESLA
jgi:sugar O-acyltransferase (sialic acid O-acetyltransferase NeuD family)